MIPHRDEKKRHNAPLGKEIARTAKKDHTSNGQANPTADPTTNPLPAASDLVLNQQDID